MSRPPVAITASPAGLFPYLYSQPHHSRSKRSTEDAFVYLCLLVSQISTRSSLALFIQSVWCHQNSQLSAALVSYMVQCHQMYTHNHVCIRARGRDSYGCIWFKPEGNKRYVAIHTTWLSFYGQVDRSRALRTTITGLEWNGGMFLYKVKGHLKIMGKPQIGVVC